MVTYGAPAAGVQRGFGSFDPIEVTFTPLNRIDFHSYIQYSNSSIIYE
jgi:hypothetical protein